MCVCVCIVIVYLCCVCAYASEFFYFQFRFSLSHSFPLLFQFSLVSILPSVDLYVFLSISVTFIKVMYLSIWKTKIKSKEFNMENSVAIRSFKEGQMCSEAVYVCSRCYVDIFLESKVLFYVKCDNAYFVKARESINFSYGHHTRILCSNCRLYLGFIVYHWNSYDNELRLTGTVPKYNFR